MQITRWRSVASLVTLLLNCICCCKPFVDTHSFSDASACINLAVLFVLSRCPILHRMNILFIKMHNSLPTNTLMQYYISLLFDSICNGYETRASRCSIFLRSTTFQFLVSSQYLFMYFFNFHTYLPFLNARYSFTFLIHRLHSCFSNWVSACRCVAVLSIDSCLLAQKMEHNGSCAILLLLQ